MATLREMIAEKIRLGNGDADTTAIEVCKLLEDRIGLEGNGWFDDDATMLDALRRR